MILAYAGWNDGGEAATTAVAHLLETFSASKLASLDMEEFVDFTVVRPHVRPREGGRREIRWPDHEFFAIRAETHDFDLVVGLGVEPHLRWRAFCGRDRAELVRRVDARLVILLGAFLDEVIYSQPIQVVGTSTDPELSRELGLAAVALRGADGNRRRARARRSRATARRRCHSGRACRTTCRRRRTRAPRSRCCSASRRPPASRSTRRRSRRAAATFDQEVSEAIAADPQLSAYVRELKRRAFSQ